MKNPIRALKQWLETKIVKWDTSRTTNRDLRDPSTGETEILKIVIPCVRYNPDTGQMANWDTFGEDMNFDGDVNILGELTLNANTHLVGPFGVLFNSDGDVAFVLGDNAGAYDLNIQDSDNVGQWFCDSNGNVIQVGNLDVAGNIEGTDITSTDDVIVGDDIVLGLDQRITLDDDEDTYIYCNADDSIRTYAGGTLRTALTSGRTYYYQPLDGVDAYYLARWSYLEFKERASAPSPGASYGHLWVKNTTPCELWFTDDAGTSTKIV